MPGTTGRLPFLARPFAAGEVERGRDLAKAHAEVRLRGSLADRATDRLPGGRGGLDLPDGAAGRFCLRSVSRPCPASMSSTVPPPTGTTG